MTTRLISTTTEPVTVAEAKTRLRIDGTDDDVDIGIMIAAAREMCEQQTGRSIALATWELKLDAFPSWEIELLWPPIATVTHVKYIDTSGVLQTLDASAYTLDTHLEPGRVVPVYDTEWPTTRETENAVTVRYTAGYGASCPQALKQWILLQVGHWYRNREAATDRQMVVTPFGDGLLDRYRVF